MPIDVRPDHLQIVQDILKTHVPDYEIWVFGSRAKWTAKDTSDLDICIKGKKILTLNTLAHLRDDFSESSLPYKVDVVDWYSVSESFRKIIERDKVELPKANDGIRRKVKLKDICLPRIGVQTGPFGSQLHKKDYVDKGTPIITVEHLADNRITHQNLPLVSDQDKERLKKYTLQKGDIVFSRVGSVDRRALIRANEDGWMFSGRCLRVRLDEKKAVPAFVAFQFGTESFKEHIRSIAVGATMPSINTKILSDVEIILPPLHEQKEIADILSALDDKIEVNRQMNKTLETTARALFKSWFIDFEPILKKKKDPNILSSPIISLFPNDLINSPLGKIPSGWTIATLGDVLQLSYGKPLKAENRIEGKIAVYGSNGIVGWHNEALVKGPGIIVGRKGNPGFIKFSHFDFFPIDTTFYVELSDSLPSMIYAWLLLETLDLPALSADSAVPGLNRNAAYSRSIILPPIELVKLFEQICQPWIRRIADNEVQLKILIDIRNTLLPKLISGELRVDTAASKVKEAV